MDKEEYFELELKEEKRLISTLITQKPSFSGGTAVVLTLLLMTLFSQAFWLDLFQWAKFLPAVKVSVFDDQQWWRVFTAIFIHGDFGHFLSNMLMLSVFSFFVFGYFGLRAYPLLAYILAGLVNALAILTYDPNVRLLGASGLVYLLGGFWLTLYYFIQRQYGSINRLLRVSGIGLMLFFPTSFSPQTSYRTHAIGMGVGFIMGVLYFIKNKKQIRSHEVYKVDLV